MWAILDLPCIVNTFSKELCIYQYFLPEEGGGISRGNEKHSQLGHSTEYLNLRARPKLEILENVEAHRGILDIKWASSWDYGTYHIGNQQRRRRACAFAQSRQSLSCLHTWSMEVDERSDQKSDKDLAQLDGCACVFEERVYGGQKVP